MKVNNKVETFFLKKNIWHGLTITHSAAHQIKQLVKNSPAMLGLRLSIKESGCAGFSYVIKEAKWVENSDLIYEHDGARLYVPLKAMPLIDGTELDYVQQGLNHIFQFNNPKAKHSCGCGESFGF
ncbi:Fe-S cluster assembly scaffold SufA [Sodalis endosymbiont of Henestaris halophilus]|uniref:Fe-S cluster assembly scaffold SufA n=1 Tax=Sodalis endosymbiont of Henestaris halophilus TaxID=1929246 RepID=UPI000BC06546|nr:Fe-S cluster assembly scaffold SufA [Sodalis endosymbiont of Henestaris halophilus]SNC58807.1 Iron-binding protein IscA [Sodalis endosymbiont of Henestaris halophilus]